MNAWETTALQRVADALERAGSRIRWFGSSRFRATCPCHHDKRPSLAVGVRDGFVLIKDFGGCPSQRVIAHLGFTWADLREHQRVAGHVPQQVVDTYEYANAEGEVYARKIRLGPVKEFRWERRDTSTRSGWRRRLDGLKPSLFGLEHVIGMREVFIAEGEKAARLLQNLGVPAVAPPYGANKWLIDWTATLWRAGVASVVVLADADAAGRRHAGNVAAICHDWRPAPPEAVQDDPWPDVALDLADPEGEPLAVRLVALPGLEHGEDVHDWLTTRGHTVDELRAVAAKTPRWQRVDPVARRRQQGRERAQRHRARKRARLAAAASMEV